MGKDDQYCTELSVFCIVLLVLCEATGPFAHADKDGNRTFAIFSLPRVFCCLCSKFFVLGSDSEQTEAGEWAARTAWHHGHWSNEWSERFFQGPVWTAVIFMLIYAHITIGYTATTPNKTYQFQRQKGFLWIWVSFMLPKEQNLKQMNAMYDANPRILEDVHRAVQGGKEESWIFRGWRHWKKRAIWSKVVLQRMVILLIIFWKK